jgi:trehalose 6-phosphate synthase/phosphatase
MTVELFTTPESYPVWSTLTPLVIPSSTSTARRFNYRYVVFTTKGVAVKYEGQRMSSSGHVVDGLMDETAEADGRDQEGSMSEGYADRYLEGGEDMDEYAQYAQYGGEPAPASPTSSPPRGEGMLRPKGTDAAHSAQPPFHNYSTHSNPAYRSLSLDESLDVSSSIVAVQDVYEAGLVNTESGKRDVTAEFCCGAGSKPSSPTQPLVPPTPPTGTPPTTTSSETPASSTPASSQRRGLFLVCYHLPLSLSTNPTSGAWEAKWTHSLIAKTDGSVSDDVPTFWVGGLTIPGLSDADETAIEELLSTMNVYPIFVSVALNEDCYLGMCKQVLWPAFHNVDLLDLSTSEYGNKVVGESFIADASSSSTQEDSIWDQTRYLTWWKAYVSVNRIFSDKLNELVKEGDNVWVHDYHLALLPQYMSDYQNETKGGRITNTIFFLHIPFPTSQIFRELECGTLLLEGMLCADVVGFHAFDHARHFLNACKRIMGLSYETREGGLIGLDVHGRSVMVTMSHVSIEPTVLRRMCGNAEDVKDVFLTKHKGRKIIAGIDVAQKLAGLPLKFLAYERLLHSFPKWQRSVVLVQRCFAPSNRIGDERNTLREIRAIVGRIRNTFGDDVVDYEEINGNETGRNAPIIERCGLWMAADVWMGTAIREGLNLHPLEYVFCRENAGVVIGSEFSSACQILNGALRINPFDVQMTATTIDSALRMPKQEREARRARDIEVVSNRTASQWSRHVLNELNEAVKAQKAVSFEDDSGAGACTKVDFDCLKSAYDKSSKRVIICDYGGTILSKEATGLYIKKDVSSTAGRKPNDAVLDSIEALAADPRNTVFVVSGVNRRELEVAFSSIEKVGLAASNGASFAWPAKQRGGERVWRSFQFGVDWEGVKRVAIPIMSKYSARTNGSSLKVLGLSLSWSYFSCDPEWGAQQAKYIIPELVEALKSFDVQVVGLKGQIEVIPSKLNKGVVVKRILREASVKAGAFPEMILCVGDDKSDEAMFKEVFEFLSEQADPSSVKEAPAELVPLDGSEAGPGGGGGGGVGGDGGGGAETTTTARRRTSSSGTDALVNLPKFDPATPQYAFTITVGKKATIAAQYVHDTDSVERMFGVLSGTGGQYGGRTTSWEDSRSNPSTFYDV